MLDHTILVGVAAVVVAVLAVVAVILVKRQTGDPNERAVADLGSVSSSWIVEHRTEPWE